MNFYPWVVRVSMTDENGTIHKNCGGSMVSNQHVITATHCTVNQSNIFVYANGHPYKADIVYEAPGYYEEPFFAGGHKDLSVLKLRTVPSGCLIPLCLPKNKSENVLFNGDLVLASFQGGT